ncbi:MAG: hypothetical protein NZ480_05150, partial [Bdellovibrionaceae bacterium]|nr:hypothetical protein [Pseudobdellovibrionaceae bacterium]
MKHILIIGSGRIARHFQFYLSHLGFNVKLWSRQEGETKLKSLIDLSATIMLAVPDDHLHDWCSKILEMGNSSKSKALIHFSGARREEHWVDLHPLGSFDFALFPPSFYSQITLVSSRMDAPFYVQKALPGLP